MKARVERATLERVDTGAVSLLAHWNDAPSRLL
jgi:ABC-type transporter Mla MlaB component